MLLSILAEYEKLSGQKVNLSKSSVLFSSHIVHDEKVHLATRMGIQMSVGKED